MAEVKRVILSDSSLNRYGYRVLTEGIRLEQFKKNPIMLWMHFRDEGSKTWGESKPIGYWDDIQVNDDVLSAVPVFDDVDELSKTIHAKYDAGTIRACSIGFYAITTSSDKKYLAPGQTRETVVEADLVEASFADIPANGNAVRLYSQGANTLSLSSSETTIPILTNNSDTQMKMNAAWKALSAFLGLSSSEAEITTDQLTKVDSELERLTAEQTKLTQELDALKAEKLTLNGQVNTLTTERDALKEKETKLTSDLAAANDQITALKGKPAEQSASVTPTTELNATDSDATFLKFLQDHKGDTLAIAAEMERLKLV